MLIHHKFKRVNSFVYLRVACQIRHAVRAFISLKKRCEVHKFIKLRQRHIYTRSNHLRLRYFAAGFSSLFVMGVILFSAIPSSWALKWPDFQIEQKASKASAEGMASLSDIINLARIGAFVPDEKLPIDKTYSQPSPVTDAIQSGISNGIRKAAFVMKKPPEPRVQEIKVGSGDTVAGVLKQAGVNSHDAYYAVKAMTRYYDPRRIKPGQKIAVHFRPSAEGEALEFSSLSMRLDAVKELYVRKEGDRFESNLTKKKLNTHTYARKTEIETSLYGSAARAGIPSQIIAELIRIYSWDVDFQRDIRRGDKVEVLYETYETEDGEFARYGNLLYASLSIDGRAVPIYYYEMNDGRADYFEPDGHSIRKTLMRTPVDGARLSSGFGMRKHPVLGYNKMHKGSDFAASTGTPIYAAGDGVLDFAGRNGGYGNYIRIRHNATLKTAYAHMNRLAKGMSKGKRVEQGQIIGYVGSTGRSTGPHLHYEVLVNGKQVNPSSVNLPTGEQLKGRELERFDALRGALQQQYVALTEGLKFAQKSTKNHSSTVR